MCFEVADQIAQQISLRSFWIMLQWDQHARDHFREITSHPSKVQTTVIFCCFSKQLYGTHIPNHKQPSKASHTTWALKIKLDVSLVGLWGRRLRCSSLYFSAITHLQLFAKANNKMQGYAWLGRSWLVSIDHKSASEATEYNPPLPLFLPITREQQQTTKCQAVCNLDARNWLGLISSWLVTALFTVTFFLFCKWICNWYPDCIDWLCRSL